MSMIRKVQGYEAWIGTWKDLTKYIVVPRLGTENFMYYNLPLFDTRPTPIPAIVRVFNDEIVLLVFFNGFTFPPFSLDFIEQANKRWNEFYE